MNQNRRIDLKERTFQFALSVVQLYSMLSKTSPAREIGQQMLRSGTSIGANVEEAYGGFSKKDFCHSMNIAKKEARETKYWLRLIAESNILDHGKIKPLLSEADELNKILTSIVKTSQGNHK